MVKLLERLCTDVICAFVQPFLFSIIVALLALFFYMYAADPEGSGQGYKKSLLIVLNRLQKNQNYRKLFILVFVIMQIAFITLLNRDIWKNPFSHIFGNLIPIERDTNTGEWVIVFECVENIILMIPLAATILWYLEEIDRKYELKLKYCVITALKYSFTASCSIELLQMIFKLGTVQVSDVLYNSLGGIMGGLTYCIMMKIKRKT